VLVKTGGRYGYLPAGAISFLPKGKKISAMFFKRSVV